MANTTRNGKAPPKERLVLNQMIRQMNEFARTVNGGRPVGNQLPFTTPRSMMLDSRLSGKRDLKDECDYPKHPTLETYNELYEEDPVANRVVGVYPDECWSVDPDLYETEEETETGFERAFAQLVDEVPVWHYLHRLDVQSGIGNFGALLFGFDDGLDLSSPVPGLNAQTGEPRANKSPSKLLYLRSFDQTTVKVKAVDKDKRSPRHGQPVTYSINFADPEALDADFGTHAPSTNEADVHWTRILHCADNRRSSETVGVPRMKPVLFRIMDLRKILGGSAEMFWQGAFPGISFESLPEMTEEDLDLDTVKEQMRAYFAGLQRWLALDGMTAKPLTPQVASPEAHVEQQLKVVCATIQVPMRVFMGSEAGQLASGQDVITWNRRLVKRQKKYLEPMVIRPFVRRLVAVGALPRVDRFYVSWSDLNALGDKDRADVALKKSQALLQYVTGGCEAVLPPLQFLTTVMGFTLPQAQAVLKAAEALKEKGEDAGLTDRVWNKKKDTPGPDEDATKSGNRPARNALGA